MRRKLGIKQRAGHVLPIDLPTRPAFTTSARCASATNKLTELAWRRHQSIQYTQTLIQPFVNYNLPHGWYLSSSPIMTANWEAPSSDQWTVPVGGGVGKLWRVGKVGLPVNTQLQAFYNAEKPKFGPDWQLRFQVQFLFPK